MIHLHMIMLVGKFQTKRTELTVNCDWQLKTDWLFELIYCLKPTWSGSLPWWAGERASTVNWPTLPIRNMKAESNPLLFVVAGSNVNSILLVIADTIGREHRFRSEQWRTLMALLEVCRPKTTILCIGINRSGASTSWSTIIEARYLGLV